MGIKESDINVWPEKKDLTRRFHVLVVNSARDRIGSIVEAHNQVLLIADECHRYASAENGRALQAEFSAAIGLTATADRDFDDGLERILIPYIGPIIYRYSLAQAKSDGVVSDFFLVNVRSDLSDAEQTAYDKLTKSIGRAMSEGDEEKAKQLAMRRSFVSKNAISRITAAISISEQLRGRKTIVFHESIDQAELLAKILKDRKHRVVTYHSQISKDIRRDNLRMFKTGMADVLVCCRALDEGIDVPEADSAILVASTSSHRQRVQRLGRVLRKHPDKDHAEIFTVYTTDQEETNLRKELTDLDGVASVRWMKAG
jgi:superfamily II DNA or RNA helicase